MLAERVSRRLDAGGDPEQVLALVADRRAARELARTLAESGVAGVRLLGYVAFAQGLVERYWRKRPTGWVLKHRIRSS